MAGKTHHDWPDDDALIALIAEAGSVAEFARRSGINREAIRHRIASRGLEDRARAARARRPVALGDAPEDDFAREVHALVRRRKRVSVEQIADQLDSAPRRVREALDLLRERGYRVPEQQGEITLEPVNPDQVNLHKLDPRLLDGDVLRVGVVSDTHLASNEEALAELHLAYDHFASEGISEVWHAGDLVCGLGIFPGQASEIKRHTFEDQVDYAVEHYPRRAGIRTRLITGNHDVEGQFGRVGANPVVAVANRRDDLECLGDYSAWIELPNGAWVHLLHGKGGMSYAYSYKAQKLVDGYPAGRKPAILIPGHWHVRGNISARNVEVLWPGCFEWRSKFLERLGLHPKVGFHVLTLTIGDDGSLVRFLPEWLSFYQGRVVAGASVHADREEAAA